MRTLLFLLFALVFASCSTEPDNIIHQQRTDPGKWVIDSTVSKPVQSKVEMYMISPTWGQSIDYASMRNDRLLKVIGALAFFVLFVALFIGRATEASWFPRFLYENVFIYSMTLFISLAFTVQLYFGDAIGIKWNNDKWITKTEYDNAMKSGSTKPIWDSLRTNCLIVDGPYDCYK